MNYDEALNKIKEGYEVRRASWSKDQVVRRIWIQMSGVTLYFISQSNLEKQNKFDSYEVHFWYPSNEDMNAKDWENVHESN